MFTPTRNSTPATPAEPYSGQRISLSLSDLVSPGLKEFDEAESRSSVISGNDGTNYKKELKKLLLKSRGTAYEATLRRFVEQKYNDIKKDEASNRKLFGHARGAVPGSVVSVASLSHSKYDAPASSDQKESSIYGLSSTYHDGRIVENNFNTLGSRPSSPFQSSSRRSAAPPGPQNRTPNGQGNNISFSLPNDTYASAGKNASLDVTYNNKSRIAEMAKPMERNVYKAPVAASPFSPTNHLGRQRPPPPKDTSRMSMSRSPERRVVSSSPYASPYRQRKLAEEQQQQDAMMNDSATVSSYPELFQSLAQHAEIMPQQGARSYEEFQEWLANNRDWVRKRSKKVQSIGAEVMKDTTHDFTPKILSKSAKLADAANRRAFQRIAAKQGHSQTGTGTGLSVDGLSENGLAFVAGNATKVTLARSHSRSPHHSRSRSRSPVATHMRSFAPTPYPEAEVVRPNTAPVGKVRADSVSTVESSTMGHLPPHQRHSSLNTTTSAVTQSSHNTHNTHYTQITHATSSSSKPRAGSAQPGNRSRVDYDDLSVASAPVHSHSAVPVVMPPSDVFERLAVRGRLEAHKTYNWDLPPPQDSYAPMISERSVRLAEKKHQRDANISRARSASASRAGAQSYANEYSAEQQYLERNYDYYELYTMPERYMYRVAHPEKYKMSGTVPCNNIRNAEEKLVLEGSGLSKVTRDRRERAARSASPSVRTNLAASSASVSSAAGTVSHRGLGTVPQHDASHLGIARTSSADHAMQIGELGSSGLNISTALDPHGHPLQSSLPVRPDSGGKYYTHLHTDPQSQRVSCSPKPRSAQSPRPYSPGRDTGNQSEDQNRHIVSVVKEGIQQKKALSKSMREHQLAEFNRRHYLSKETKDSKPFQPLLLATETHRIMSRVNSTFEDRSNKAVENLFVRREVARRFPSPGPGRYTSGIGVEKIVQTLSVGSPQKLSRSRSMSPAPGHKGFSFGKEALNRFVDPADPIAAAGGKAPSAGFSGTNASHKSRN